MATGRIRKRVNSWGYIINLPYDPKRGNYPTIRKSGFSTRDLAFTAMTKAVAEINSGEAIFSTMKVDAYLEEWLEQIKDKVAPRTWGTYQDVKKMMHPYIGDLRLDKLDHIVIEDMYEKLKARKLASSTIHRVIRAALNRAVKRGILKKSPMIRVDSPSGKIDRRLVLDIDQANQLLNWLQKHHYVSYIAAFLALYTGMRRGEICGLQWQDVDFDHAVIRVVRTRQRIKNKKLSVSPKQKVVQDQYQSAMKS